MCRSSPTSTFSTDWRLRTLTRRPRHSSPPRGRNWALSSVEDQGDHSNPPKKLRFLAGGLGPSRLSGFLMSSLCRFLFEAYLYITCRCCQCCTLSFCVGIPPFCGFKQFFSCERNVLCAFCFGDASRETLPRMSADSHPISRFGDSGSITAPGLGMFGLKRQRNST